jgi:hypothetical protein
MASHIERRKFLATLGGAAAAWPLAAGAQQPVMPVVGFLRSRSATASADLVAALRRGLSPRPADREAEAQVDSEGGGRGIRR